LAIKGLRAYEIQVKFMTKKLIDAIWCNLFALYGIAWNKSASSEAMTDDWLGGWTNKSDYSSQKKA
jgi:hypothetical protein